MSPDASSIAVAVLLGLHAGVLGVLLVNLAYLRRTRTWRPPPAPDASPRVSVPRVSVLVPARNEAENLRRLLPSLLAQTYPDFEVVVVDDASEDATYAVLEDHVPPFAARGVVLRPIRGDGPPPGWVGKPHALYQATRDASGEVYVFLDADAALVDAGALDRLVQRFLACEGAAGSGGAALSGLPRYRDAGGAALLTSLVPFSILSALPLPLVPRTRSASLGALNGQCWVIGADAYRRHEPHRAHADEVLEDVQIGRTLKRRGVRLHLVDLADVVAVRMYGSFGEAWRGFRKNAYLLAGGRPATFVPLWLGYAAVFAVAPWLSPWLLASTVVVKGLCDLARRLPPWLPIAAPLVFALASALQLDSALSHATGRVAWKGRAVGVTRRERPADG